MNIYITHFRKIFYIILFSAAVWFISFSIFPENQVIKIEVGDESPAAFSAPRFLTVVDEQKTEELKEDARNNVAPVYSIDSKINVSVIDGITEMFLTVIKARTEEVLVTDNESNPENPQSIVEIVELSKVEQIEKVQSSLLFSTISTSAIEVLIEISNLDNLNSSNFLTQIEFEAKSQADKFLSNGINNENLNQIRQTIVQTPPNLNLPSELYVLVPEARVRSMVGEIIAENLIANQKLEEELWNEQKNKASNAVEEVTVQFFKDEIIVNEVAPRPHNSGHWTMDACNISQFEALVRVIFDMPIPYIKYYHNCKMINILGDNYNVIEKSLNKKNHKIYICKNAKIIHIGAKSSNLGFEVLCSRKRSILEKKHVCPSVIPTSSNLPPYG